MNALVFALNEELKPILKKTKTEAAVTLRQSTITQGRFRGIPLLLCRTGIGMGNSHEGCEWLIEKFHPSLVVSAGYAGGLQPGLRPGELLLPTEVHSESGDIFSPDRDHADRLANLIEEESIPCHTGSLLTVFNALKKTAEKTTAGKRGYVGVDMETASIASLCRKNGIPLVSLRVVFDPLEMELPGTDAAGTLQQAFKIPQLVRMNLTCQQSLSRVLARFLNTSRSVGKSPA